MAVGQRPVAGGGEEHRFGRRDGRIQPFLASVPRMRRGLPDRLDPEHGRPAFLLVQEREEKMGKPYRLRAEPVGPLRAPATARSTPGSSGACRRPTPTRFPLTPVTAGTVGTPLRIVPRPPYPPSSQLWLAWSMKTHERSESPPLHCRCQRDGPMLSRLPRRSSHSRVVSASGSPRLQPGRVNCRLLRPRPGLADHPRSHSPVRAPDPVPESDSRPGHESRPIDKKDKKDKNAAAPSRDGPELSLGECIAIAVERHPHLKAVQASTAATQAGYRALMKLRHGRARSSAPTWTSASSRPSAASPDAPGNTRRSTTKSCRTSRGCTTPRSTPSSKRRSPTT